MRTRKGKSPSTSPRENGVESPHAPQTFHAPQVAARVAAGSAARYDRLDVLRGFALIWMAIFHFCFDLSNYRLLNANFYSDPLWTTQRTCILSLFLLCAGAGQAVATSQGQSWARFGRRWAQIAGCAMLVSIGSAQMFPKSYIYFGVLHGMAVMLIIARLSAPLGKWLWPLGLLAISLPRVIADPFFDTRWTNWVGLVTHKPITEDYVPVLPWLGVMLWGLAATQWVLAHKRHWLAWALPAASCPSSSTAPSTEPSTVPPASQSLSDTVVSGDNTCLARALHGLRQSLALLGRWSLTFYMVHQPVLIGALVAWMTLTGRAGN